MYLPSEMKHLIELLPKITHQVVQVPELSKSLGKTIIKMRRDQYLKSLNNLKKNIHILNIDIVEKINTSLPLSEKNASAILNLFFEQLALDQDVHIDFRSKYFSEYKNGAIWKPSKLRYHFDSSFQKGVKNIYQGFFCENDLQLEMGLEQLDLIDPDFMIESRNKFKLMLEEHFGNSKEENIKLDLEHFRQSFYKVVEFFSKHNKKISPEFAYFGIYLLTLFIHLDALPYKLNIKDAFLQSSLSKM